MVPRRRAEGVGFGLLPHHGRRWCRHGVSLTLMDTGQALADRDLHSVLAGLGQAAAELVGQPLRPVSENLAGYIETIWAERPGVVWMTGWVRRDAGQEFAVVLADRRKYPGAIAIACYERPDLPGEAHAFVGMLQTDWQPSRETTDVFLFIGPELKHFIRSVSPLRLQEGPAFAAEFSRVQALCHAGRVNALRGMLLDGQSWLPDTAALSGATVKAAIDALLVLPGFGCFIQGWVLSPTKRLVRLSVKLADRVLQTVPGSLYFVPRHDLAEAMPNMPGLLDRAGFVAVLTGPLQPEDLISPVLKAWFSDGTSVNFPLDPLVIRRLGHAVPYEAALRLFPGMAAEGFFARCAAAIRSEVVGRLSEVQPLNRVMPAERCVVAVLPQHASDARLMVDQIGRHLAGQALPVALVADRSVARAGLPLMAELVHATTGAPCATFLVEDPTRPLFALGRVLELLGAGRFLFLSAGVFPEPAAWQQALGTLLGAEEGLAVITTTDGLAPAGMAWTTKAFQLCMAEDGCAIGSTHGDQLLARAVAVAGTARLSSVAGRRDQLLEAVDTARLGRGQDR